MVKTSLYRSIDVGGHVLHGLVQATQRIHPHQTKKVQPAYDMDMASGWAACSSRKLAVQKYVARHYRTEDTMDNKAILVGLPTIKRRRPWRSACLGCLDDGFLLHRLVTSLSATAAPNIC